MVGEYVARGRPADRGRPGRRGQVRVAVAGRRRRRRAPVAGSPWCRTTREAALLAGTGLADEVVVADARSPLGLSEAVAAAGGPADVTVVCVDVPGCEQPAILSTAQGGTIIFFSMATNFAAAALGAEGVAADVRMLVGNGYVPGHAAYALELVRGNAAVRGPVRGAAGRLGETGTVTTLYRGGFVYSPVDPFANALVVDDATGTIAWIGGDDAAAVHADAVDEVVELDGALVTPAFVDAHAHVSQTGAGLRGVDLGDHPQRRRGAQPHRGRRADAARAARSTRPNWDQGHWAERPPAHRCGARPGDLRRRRLLAARRRPLRGDLLGPGRRVRRPRPARLGG